MTASEPLAVDIRGVAELLNVSRAHVYGMIAAGRFPIRALRLGRSVRYSVDEVRAWLAAGAPPADKWHTKGGR